MTNETQTMEDKRASYQPIKKTKRSIFNINDNEIIIRTLEKIEQYYKQKREIKTEYYYYPLDLRLNFYERFKIKGPPVGLIKQYDNNGKLIKPIISGIKIESKDGVVRGEIGQDIRWSSCLFSAAAYYAPPNVYVEFNFNSNNPKDKEEYLGLAKIIKEM